MRVLLGFLAGDYITRRAAGSQTGRCAFRSAAARIITSGKTWLRENEMPVWRQSHERLAASIPGAKLIVASESDHMIPEREPELVIKAIVDIIADYPPM